MSTSAFHPAPQHHDDQARVLRRDDALVLHPDDVLVIDVRTGAGGHGDPVQRVTSARGSHSEDVARRMRNYAISMGIRTLCVLVAIIAFPHWYAWLFVPGAVLLPYVAVILANAGRERAPGAPAVVAPATTNLPVLRTARPR